ncbi:DNA polymerase III subunit alpha [Piscirickettsia salmonis]|uniref:DNA polymerase III subunit alpha n=1 Tax=Piscirickettsia salmonis TaxID=1238 RepID=UPI003EC0BC29
MSEAEVLRVSPQFVHLRVHTEYSLIKGIVRIKPLIQSVQAKGMRAVAMTDHANLFGLIKFYRTARDAGIKPLVGAEIWVQHEGDQTLYPLLLLCQNKQGYDNLCSLLSKAYLYGQVGDEAIIQSDWLIECSGGLIALSGGKKGDIGQALLQEKRDLANARLHAWCELFPGRFYLELQRTSREQDEDYIHSAVVLASEAQVPVVATNDVCFLKKDDFDAHEARVCIHDGVVLIDPRREKNYSRMQYLRSETEMAELFSDIPEALKNSIEIAKRCNLTLNLGQPYLPNFPIPVGKTTEEYFIEQARDGLAKRLEVLLDQAQYSSEDAYQSRQQVYLDRLDFELNVINQMGFAGYFLIVADFISWAKEKQIPVGPGRGSGAGSLVAYSLLITDLDPLAYDLLFERFLNPERVSMPDFDIDFCMEGRDRVIGYVAETYGRYSVSQIITFGAMAAKAVVRDVGRVLSQPYGMVDKVAKLIPNDLGMTLTKALAESDELSERYQNEEDIAALIDLALKLEGVTRNVGRHAAGVVIAPSVVSDYTPIYCESGSNSLITQFDKDDVESAGLVKFDFLGLRTLTIIDWALKAINTRLATENKERIDIARIALDDVKAFDVLKACQTTAVFQLESRGMKELIHRLQPDCFEDIIALVALYRPGPLGSGMVDDFINRKHGRAEIEYPHPSLEACLKPTYGVILYQEQVMQIAQVLSGYTLGGADMLRRAMGKKKQEEMDRQRVIFVEGAVKNNVDKEQASAIFDLVDKFAGYGFNKSHSAAYALLSYQTAWLKAYYPAEFMAAVLSADLDNTDKVVLLIQECDSLKLNVIFPHVNHSQYQFTVNDQGAVVYGLGAVKGVGRVPIDELIKARQSGWFTDLFDFCLRVDLKKFNKRVFESLIRAGAFDGLGPHRASLLENLPRALQFAEQQQMNQQQGIDDLFALAEAPESGSARMSVKTPELIAVEKWPDDIRLKAEKETLGLYLSGHPIDQYLAEISALTTCRLADLQVTSTKKTVVIAGIVVALRVMKTKRGTRMAILTLDDHGARVEMAVFSESFEAARELLVIDELVVVEGEAGIDDYSGQRKINAKNVWNLQSAREQFASHLLLKIQSQDLDIAAFKHLLEGYRGECPVRIDYYTNSQLKGQLRLGMDWRVCLADEFIVKLKQGFTDQGVEVCYA